LERLETFVAAISIWRGFSLWLQSSPAIVASSLFFVAKLERWFGGLAYFLLLVGMPAMSRGTYPNSVASEGLLLECCWWLLLLITPG